MLLIVICAMACSFTTSAPPDLNGNSAAVLDSLKAKYGFEDISLMGKTETGTSGKQSTLTVKFINGRRFFPSDSVQIAKWEKQLASNIKSILKNSNDFETVVILLDRKTVSGESTNEVSTGREFELKNL